MPVSNSSNKFDYKHIGLPRDEHAPSTTSNLSPTSLSTYGPDRLATLSHSPRHLRSLQPPLNQFPKELTEILCSNLVPIYKPQPRTPPLVNHKYPSCMRNPRSNYPTNPAKDHQLQPAQDCSSHISQCSAWSMCAFANAIESFSQTLYFPSSPGRERARDPPHTFYHHGRTGLFLEWIIKGSLISPAP